ncbi:MAG: LysE family transporter [Ignavibacteriales bacterium]|nr:LysE family transporter [Ignavibacteriales bacterium]
MHVQSELIIPFITYAIVTSITPGPNNVSSASAGMQLGYRKTLPYLYGIVAGFFILLAVAGLLTGFITGMYESFSPVLKWIGIVYMLWLAVMPFLPGKSKKQGGPAYSYSFFSGMILQLVNIKAILYSITIFSSFAGLISVSPGAIILSAVFLTFVTFGCISTWVLIGSTLAKYFENRQFYIVFNAVMALLLVYSAVSILYN